MAPLVSNIIERQAHIRQLLEESDGISTKKKFELSRLYQVNIARIYLDIAFIQKSPSYYSHRISNQVSSENGRATRIGAEGRIEPQEWRDLLERYNHACAKCKRKALLAIDHIVPLSKGGTNTIDNVQPLCNHCNQRKRTESTDYR